MGLIFDLLTGIINRSNLGVEVHVLYGSSEPGHTELGLGDNIALSIRFGNQSSDKIPPR